MHKIILIAHNLRSAHNVGSLIRTGEGLGLEKIFLTGYSPYPLQSQDTRLPFLAQKIDKRIKKTSLGAEDSIDVIYEKDILKLINDLKKDDYKVLALEQDKSAIKLNEFTSESNIALVVGNEVDGLEQAVISLCDAVIEIPMLGKKESFNVVQSAAMALYHCRYP
jgi:23S rRNA (guanosine2251-2'-O)-methyltransferase